MIKRIIGVLLGIIFLFVGVTFAQDIEKYSVHIYSIGFEGIGSCTGTVIDETDNSSTVLTCKHCVSVDQESYVDNKKVIKVMTSSGEDLAILVTDEKIPNKEIAKFSPYDGLINDRVYIYGKPGFTVTHQRDGRIITFTNEWGFAQLNVVAGCSGSGLFNDKNEIIGVVWGAYSEPASAKHRFLQMFDEHDIGIFTPLFKIRNFLNKLAK